MDIDSIGGHNIATTPYAEEVNNLLYLHDENKQFMRSEIIKAIDEGYSLGFTHSNKHFGDHFIIRSALSTVLRKISEVEKTGIPSISLKHEEDSARLDLRNLTTTYGQGYKFFEELANNIHHAHLLWLSSNLGVELSSSDFLAPPAPYWCDFDESPMHKFSWKDINYYRKVLSMDMNSSLHYNILFHGGSSSVKRFTKTQVREIKEAFDRHYPESGFIIITAQSYDDGNGAADLDENDADLTIDTVQNLNLAAAAYLFPKNVSLISTDTFGAWFGAGMIASRPDRKGMLMNRDVYVLNTIASPGFWNIPGANHVKSGFIHHLEENGRFKYASDNIAYSNDYKQFYGTNNIDQEDIDSLVSRIHNQHILASFRGSRR